MSVAPAFENPTRTIFNMNNFESSTNSYLGNKGKQRLIGDLTTNNDTTLNDEVVYGTSNVSNLIVENDTTFSREPVITSITASASLTDYNLVSKKYVTDELLKVESNPYPIFYTYGKHFTGNGVAPSMANPSPITLGVREPSSAVETGVFEIMYQFTKSGYNSTTPIEFIKYYGVFLAHWTKLGGGYLAPQSILVSGGDMRGALNDYAGIVPITFGVSQSKPAISVQFPAITNNVLNNSQGFNWWISSYSVSIRIINSNPVSTTSNFTIKAPMNDGSNSYTGNLYFL